MTDASPAPLNDLVDAACAQAAEIATLDAPRAEAWASDLLALAADEGIEPTDLVGALAGAATDDSAIALLALSGLMEIDTSAATTRPEWAAAIDTSRCEGAWILRAGGARSIAFRFVDALDSRHVITVDLVPGKPETIGEVMVASGDVLDALEESDGAVEVEEGDAADLAGRVGAAFSATTEPPDSAVVAGRVLIRRLVVLGVDEPAPLAFFVLDIPAPPERDPEDDAYAVDVLVRALGGVDDVPGPAVSNRCEGAQRWLAASPGDTGDLADVVAGAVGPIDLAPLEASERDAVMALEWADWLGAVIGLVRAGAGQLVDGERLVDAINRCPEVTSTIPKADRDRIAWAFDAILDVWNEIGILEGGILTEVGATVLPTGLRRAWMPHA